MRPPLHKPGWGGLLHLALDSRPIGWYHRKDKFALTFIRGADLNFMQSG
jgi:hypothetical protein